MRKIIVILVFLSIAFSFVNGAVFYVSPIGADDPAHGVGPGPLAFMTINYALSMCAVFDTINVETGIYTEHVVISNPVTLLGPNYSKHALDTRDPEASILLSGPQAQAVLISSDNVEVSGFMIDGAAASACITNDFVNGLNNIVIKNNLLLGAQDDGIYFDSPGPGGTGSMIRGNLIGFIVNEPGEWQMTKNHSIVGRAVVLQNNMFTDVIDNVFTDVFSGVYTRTFSNEDTCRIDSNIIEINANNTTDGTFFTPAVPSKPGIGISNYQHSGNAYFYVSYNTITKYNSAADTFCNGISCVDIYDNAGIYYYMNNIDDMANGYALYNCPTSNTITIRGGEIGVDTTKNKTGLGIGLSNVNVDDMGFLLPEYSFAENSNYIIDSVNIHDCLTWGVYAFGADDSDGGTVHMSLSNSLIERTNSGESDYANIYIFNTNRHAVTADVTSCEISGSKNRGVTTAGGGALNFTNCAIHDNSSYGLMLRNRVGTEVSVANCTFYNNSVHVNFDYNVTNNTSSIHDNSFTGTGTVFRNYRSVPIDLVNASCNWYNTNSEASITGKFTAMSGYADYSPWLDTGDDMDASTGFTPDHSAVHVSYSSPSADGSDYATEGLARIDDWGTVYLKAGSYTEDLDVTKNCKLSGIADINSINMYGDGGSGSAVICSIAGSVTVNDSVKFINGGIESPDTLILGSSCVMLDESADHHLNGYVKTIRTVGTGSENFGNIGVSMDAGASDLGNVTVARLSGNGMEVAPQTISKMWYIESDNAPINRNTTFTWFSSDDNGINLANAYIVNSPDNAAPEGYAAYAGPYDMSSRNISEGLTHFSYWTISDNTSLPVFAFFCTGTYLNDRVVLNWSMESVENIGSWIIERKSGNSDYSVIARLDGRVRSFEDYDVEEYDVYTYRISDTEGSVKSMEIRLIGKFTSIKNHLSSSIANDRIIIDYSTDENSQINVYDITGKCIYKSTSISGQGHLNIDKNKMAQGIYFVRMLNSQRELKSKFVIIK